mgnify:CR=1 FL=1
MLNVKMHQTVGKRRGLDSVAKGWNISPRINPNVMVMEALRPRYSNILIIISYKHNPAVPLP